MTTILIAGALQMAASVLQAGSSIMGGRAQALGLANEAGQYDSQAKGTDLQAIQSSERRREDFRASVAGLTTMFAQQNRSPDSQTAQAIEKELRRQTVRDEGVERLGYVNQAGSLRAGARAKRAGAKNVILLSYLDAAGTVWKGAQVAAAAAGPGRTGGYTTSSWRGSIAPSSSFKW